MKKRIGILAMIDRHIEECERKIAELQEELKYYQKTGIHKLGNLADNADKNTTGEQKHEHDSTDQSRPEPQVG